MGYAGVPETLSVLCKGGRARRPQGFWFLSQPVLFWPEAPIHPSVHPSHSPPGLHEAPLECGALRTLGIRSGYEGPRQFFNFIPQRGLWEGDALLVGKAKEHSVKIPLAVSRWIDPLG